MSLQGSVNPASPDGTGSQRAPRGMPPGGKKEREVGVKLSDKIGSRAKL